MDIAFRYNINSCFRNCALVFVLNIDQLRRIWCGVIRETNVTVQGRNCSNRTEIYCLQLHLWHENPDSKVHGANMGPTWVLSAPDGLHVGPMNLAIREKIQAYMRLWHVRLSYINVAYWHAWVLLFYFNCPTSILALCTQTPSICALPSGTAVKLLSKL